jgi:hypothetical protein
MQSEIIAVLGTLSGALLGGLINYFSNRGVKSHEWRLALARDQIAIRKKLYAEFLVEVQQHVAKARDNKISSLSDLNPIHGKYAEICLVASPSVTDAAKKLADYAIVSSASQPAKEVAEFFLLKERFILVARDDMAKVLIEA